MRNSLTLLRFLLQKHPFRAAFVLLIALSVIFASVGLLATSAWLIAFCALTPLIAEILVPVVYVRLFGLLRGILRYFERLISHETTFRLLGDLRVTLYRAISLKPPISILRLDQGDAFSRLVDDIERLQDFYLRTFNPALTAVLTLLLGYFLIGSWGSQEALGFVSIYGVTLLILPGIVYAWTAGLSRQKSQQTSGLRSFIVEMISGLADLQSSGALQQRTVLLTKRISQLEATELKLADSRAFSAFWIALATPLAGALIAGIGGIRVLNGALNPLFLPVEIFAVMALFEALQTVPTLLQKIEATRLAASRVLELLDPDSLKETAHDVHLPEFVPDLRNCRIHLDQVSCRYPEMQTDLLKNIDVQLHSGQKLAIVGASGSGKTTLTYLLLGWLQPAQGSCTVYEERSDADSARLAIDSVALSECFSVVNQDVYLFNTTLRNNLRIGRRTKSDDELIQALDQVLLGEWFRSLPEGLETNLGEGDGLLSGGQRQRIGIARALLRKAPFLILDEATAGIDAATEQLLMQGILTQEARQRSGVLTITHRLVAMEQYDEIVVLENGQIAERGTHKQLIARQGLYQRMWYLNRI